MYLTIIKLVWGFVSKYWWQALIVSVVLTLYGMVHFKNIEIQKQKQEITVLNIALTAEKKEVITYSNALNDQNKKIEDFGNTVKNNQAIIDQLNGVLADLNKQQDTALKQLENQKAPKTCIESQQYLKNNIKELSSW